MPTAEDVLVALREKPQTTRELVDRFAGPDDDRDEIGRRVRTLTTRLRRRQIVTSVVDPSYRNPMWMPTEKGEDDDES